MRGICCDEPASFRNIWLTSLLLVLAASSLLLLQHRPHKQQFPYHAVTISLNAFLRNSADAVADERFVEESQLTSSELLARWQPYIVEAAARFSIPAAWIRAVIKTESGGRTMLGPNRQITSAAGAMGLMQVMPETYEQMRQRYGLGDDPYDPHDNVLAGAAYLKSLHARYGNPGMFAAYNDGPGNFHEHIHHGRPLPEETRNYLHRIVVALKDRYQSRPGPAVDSRVRVIDASG